MLNQHQQQLFNCTSYINVWPFMCKFSHLLLNISVVALVSLFHLSSDECFVVSDKAALLLNPTLKEQTRQHQGESSQKTDVE